MISYLVDYTGFDFLYEPSPWQANQRHAWSSQWHKDSGTYLVPQTDYIDTNYHSQPTLHRQASAENWIVPDGVDFDYTWHPDANDPPYIYQFGTQWQKTNGPKYAVPGATDIKFVSVPRANKHSVDPGWTIPAGVDFEEFDYTWHPDATDPPYIYQFGTQWQKTNGPVYTVPGATDTKFVSAPRANKRSVDPGWTTPAGVDFEEFDYTWHPDATDPPYIYQFGTQHQRTGGPQYHVTGATDIKFVDQLQIRTNRVATAIYEIDHLDGAAGQIPNVTRRVRYFDNYRDTLIRLAKSIGTEHEFVWVCSSICDYTNFDFSWHPEQWQAGMLHVFASDEQKFGDTFFMHVPSFAIKAETVELLDWYDLNFVPTCVYRRPMPIVQHNQDSHADAVRTSDFAGPLAVFTHSTYMSRNLVTVPLWKEQTKTIVPLNPGASSVVVPRTAIPYIKTQLYDYPYIDKTHHMLTDPLQDIVFISNGESNAEQNYKRLSLLPKNNRLVRVDRINGRAAAYHAAAKASTTPWFFAVFAKLEVDIDFDFAWQPDRMQQAKHYIFHAGNPVNGLVYGHQAMIAYNKKLALENTGVGLDFTLDQAHEVVPILSGTAMYAETPWMAWRTAFREALKLRASLPDVENEYRLKVWLKEDSGTIANGHWSSKGAADAVEFYDEVKGNPTELRKSYEWSWLASYAFFKRRLTTNQ